MLTLASFDERGNHSSRRRRSYRLSYAQSTNDASSQPVRLRLGLLLGLPLLLLLLLLLTAADKVDKCRRLIVTRETTSGPTDKASQLTGQAAVAYT